VSFSDVPALPGEDHRESALLKVGLVADLQPPRPCPGWPERTLMLAATAARCHAFPAGSNPGASRGRGAAAEAVRGSRYEEALGAGGERLSAHAEP